MKALEMEGHAIDVGIGTVDLLYKFKPYLLRGQWEMYEADERHAPAPPTVSFECILRLRSDSYALASRDLTLIDQAIHSDKKFSHALHLFDESNAAYYLFFEGTIEKPESMMSASGGDVDRQMIYGEFDWKSVEEQLLQSKILLDTAIHSDVIALSVLKPVYNEDHEVRDFKWVMANKLLRAIAHGEQVIGKYYSKVFPESCNTSKKPRMCLTELIA